MEILIMYAVFMTVWALGMTIEHAKVTGYRSGYDEGYTDAKEVEEHCGHGQCCR